MFGEILRQAKDNNPSVKPASVVLYDYIRENRIQIPWEDITLPGGSEFLSQPNIFTLLIVSVSSLA
jgi:hypothetical protein